ncbi:MAG: phosphoglycerate mutase family protein [Faecalibacillus sp.]
MNQDCNKSFLLRDRISNVRRRMQHETYFVRHGRTYFNEIRLTQGWCDSPLSRTGQKQVQDMKTIIRHSDYKSVFFQS